MKKLLSMSTFSLLAISVWAGEPHAKFGPTAQRLYKSQEYVRSHPSPDYWALSPYYVPQQDGRSCSIASMTMLINAARASRNLTASDELASQEKLMKKVSKWKDALSLSVSSVVKSATSNSIGMNLDVLGSLAEESLKAYGVEVASVQVIHAEDKSATTLAKIHQVLVENEKSSKDFILANFLQSEYTGDPEGTVGHIAPVAAFDEKAKRILIMDPDREYYEPYWVSESVFLNGIATRDEGAGKNRGIVWIKLK